MFHVDNNSGVSSMPPAGAVQSSAPRWFTEGGGGTPASYPGAAWFNIVQAELLNVLSAYGIAPDKADLTQLKKAIEAAIADKATAASVLLTAIAALNTSANKLPYFNGKDTVTMTDLTAFARELLGLSDAAGVLSKLGLAYLGFNPVNGEGAVFNGNKNLRLFVNNNNETGAGSSDYGLIWGFDGGGVLTKGSVPVARLTGLSAVTGQSTTAVMSQKAVTDAISGSIPAVPSVVQAPGQSPSSVMSQKSVTDMVTLATSVGVGQLWHDVTASRAAGTTYTNDKGRPIVVAMNVKNVSAGLYASSLTVHGIELTTGSPISGEHRYISAIVPPGQTYIYKPLATSNYIFLELY